MSTPLARAARIRDAFVATWLDKDAFARACASNALGPDAPPVKDVNVDIHAVPLKAPPASSASSSSTPHVLGGGANAEPDVDIVSTHWRERRANGEEFDWVFLCATRTDVLPCAVVHPGVDADALLLRALGRGKSVSRTKPNMTAMTRVFSGFRTMSRREADSLSDVVVDSSSVAPGSASASASQRVMHDFSGSVFSWFDTTHDVYRASFVFSHPPGIKCSFMVDPDSIADASGAPTELFTNVLRSFTVVVVKETSPSPSPSASPPPPPFSSSR